MGDTRTNLVGRTGNGKSATRDSILLPKESKSKISAVGVTTTSTKKTTPDLDDPIINVVDTPGDEGKRNEQLQELHRRVKELEEDPNQHNVKHTNSLEDVGMNAESSDNPIVPPTGIMENTINQKNKKGDDETRNLVLVGRTGNGKSATGNSILGRTEFKSKISAVGVTTTCAKETVKAGGHTITVIDTPGFYDFSGDPDRIQKEIIGCMKGLEKDDGIHAVLVVLSLRNRFTKEEKNAVYFLETCFSDKIRDYMIVVITGGDELEANDESIENLLGRDLLLKEILEKCGNRYVVMDNRTRDPHKKDKQLQELYGLVELVFENNGRKPYMKDIIQTEKEESKLSNDMEKELENICACACHNAEEKAQPAQVDMKNMQQNSTNDLKTKEAEDPSGTAVKKHDARNSTHSKK